MQKSIKNVWKIYIVLTCCILYVLLGDNVPEQWLVGLWSLAVVVTYLCLHVLSNKPAHFFTAHWPTEATADAERPGNSYYGNIQYTET